MGEHDKLTTVFLKLRSALARSVSGIVPPKEIEDIVQETYIRVRSAARRAPVEHPRALLYKTARNLALDYTKRAESRLTGDCDTLDDLPDSTLCGGDPTGTTAASDQEFARFCDAVRLLPSQARQAFVLRKVYGFSQQEIAEAMGIAQSTVEKHIALGLKRTLLQIRSRDTRSDATSLRRPGTGT